MSIFHVSFHCIQNFRISCARQGLFTFQDIVCFIKRTSGKMFHQVKKFNNYTYL